MGKNNRFMFEDYSNKLAAIVLLCAVAGCTTSEVDLSHLKNQTERKSNYLDSAAIASSSKRIADKDNHADISEKVAWNGVSVFGNGLESNDLPFGSKLKPQLAKALSEKLQKVNPIHFSLDLVDTAGEAGPLKSVLALISESVSTHADALQPGKITARYSIYGDLLFLDSKNDMQVVSSYPVGSTVADTYETMPTALQTMELAKMAMFSTNRLSDGSAFSICDQVADLMAEDCVTPRALTLPIQVGQLRFQNCEVATTPQGDVHISPDTLARWADEFGFRFAGYLGSGSGLPINPYLPGGDKAANDAGSLERDRVLSASVQIAIRRNGQDQLVQAKLPRPRFMLQLQIQSLHAAVNTKESTMFSKTVNYGFTGKLVVLKPDATDVWRAVQEYPLDFPAKKQDHLPEALVAKYEKLSEAYFTPDQFNGAIDQAQQWHDNIDKCLMQLAREIAFPGEDLGKRFGSLRTKIKLNAGNGGQKFCATTIP
jgi:hypothetical protein